MKAWIRALLDGKPVPLVAKLQTRVRMPPAIRTRLCACGSKFYPTGCQRWCERCQIERAENELVEFKMYGLLLNALDPELVRAQRRRSDALYRASGKKKAARHKLEERFPEKRRARYRRDSHNAKTRNPEKFYATKHKRSVKGRIRKRFPNAAPENIEALTAIRMMINNEIRGAGDPTLRRIK